MICHIKSKKVNGIVTILFLIALNYITLKNIFIIRLHLISVKLPCILSMFIGSQVIFIILLNFFFL